MLNLKTIATSTDGQGSEWTNKTDKEAYRVCLKRNRLYRRQSDPCAYSGHVTHYVSLDNARIVQEWLA